MVFHRNSKREKTLMLQEGQQEGTEGFIVLMDNQG